MSDERFEQDEKQDDVDAHAALEYAEGRGQG